MAMLGVKILRSTVCAVVGMSAIGSSLADNFNDAAGENGSLMSAESAGQTANLVSSYQLEQASRNGIYMGGDVANMWQDWQGSPAKASGANNKTSTVYDGYLGYQYSKNFAAEVGFFYLPSVKGATMVGGGSSRGDIKSYAVDVEMKLIQPIYKHLGVFAKGGLLYRSLTLNGDTSMYVPVFGVGAAVILNPNITFDFTYNYIAGSGSLHAASIEMVPKVNMVMLGLNYNFSS